MKMRIMGNQQARRAASDVPGLLRVGIPGNRKGCFHAHHVSWGDDGRPADRWCYTQQNKTRADEDTDSDPALPQAMCRDYYELEFLAPEVDSRPIAPELARFFDGVLDRSVSQLNFRAIVDGLGDVLFKYPFRRALRPAWGPPPLSPSPPLTADSLQWARLPSLQLIGVECWVMKICHNLLRYRGLSFSSSHPTITCFSEARST